MVSGSTSPTPSTPSSSLPVISGSPDASIPDAPARFFSRLEADLWNNVIAYFTQGLLYGREVPRPAWLTKDRKRAYRPHINRAPSERIAQVTELLLRGLSRAQIAARLGLSIKTVDTYAMKAYARQRVHSLRELAAKLGRPDPLGPTKRQRVRQHLAAGLSYAQIAAEMGMTRAAVAHHVQKLRAADVPIPHPRRRAAASASA